MPINDDDAAAHGGGGDLKEWFAYRIWGVKGQWFVLLAFVLGIVVRSLV